MNRWSALALLLAFALALFLRCPQLGNRPLHNDEGTNATKLAALWDRGDYKYDPHEYHGPALYYFSLPILWLSPAKDAADLNDATLRIVTVVFGIGLIFLLFLLKDDLGYTATAWAALFLAVSPAMVFYSRYFIHEMLLVFFTLLTLAAGWRYWQSRHAAWAVLAGAGAGLMFATKETFVLSLAALFIALFATQMWNNWRARRLAVGRGAPVSDPARFSSTHRAESETSRLRHPWKFSPRHISLALLAGGMVWLLLFSSFFTNANGLTDSFLTYVPWLHRAGGASPHIHPWYFYFERLLWFHPAKGPVWSEAVITLLALAGAAAAFCGNKAIVQRPTFARFLVFYTVTLTAIYTIISYKTPWCLLNFWLGAILLAGIGAAALVAWCRTRTTKLLLTLLLGVGALHLGLESWLVSHDFTSDARNPYVYAQTRPQARELVERLEAIARVAPEARETVIKVIAPESYWPLPWYLRSFKNIGWYEAMPADPFAPVVLTSAKLGAALDEKSDKKWIMTGIYELRPNVYLELYVERGLWEKVVPTLPRDPD